MSYYWFTNRRTLDWKPKDGYNELFAEQVRLIRQKFHLAKTQKTGEEKSTGKWLPYNLQGENVFVIVDRFKWNGYREVRGSITPQFKLDLRLAKRKPKGFLASIIDSSSKKPLEVFFKNTLVIEFPEEYPSRPPFFRIDDDNYTTNSASHDHHMFRGGWFCIFDDSGEWSSRRDTIISGLNVAFDWIVWHFQEHGW